MTIGEDFSYNFNKSLLGDGSVKLDVDLGKVASWANYDSTDRMLHGHVPADLQPQTFSVKLIATRGSTKETRNLDINVSSQGNSSGSGGGVRRKQKACVIALAVVVPVVAIVVRFSYFFASGGDAQPPPKIPELDCQPIEYNTEPEKSETRHSSISSTPPPQSWNSTHSGRPIPCGKGGKRLVIWRTRKISLPDPRSNGNPGKPPALIRRRRSRLKRLSRRPNICSKTVCVEAVRTSRENESHSSQSNRGRSRDSAASSKSRRHSKRSSWIPSGVSGLPVRLSGAGHRAGGFGAPGYGIVRI